MAEAGQLCLDRLGRASGRDPLVSWPFRTMEPEMGKGAGAWVWFAGGRGSQALGANLMEETSRRALASRWLTPT